MANLRQTIIVRTDLGFPIGLLAAQVSHIHMQFVRDEVLDCINNHRNVGFNTGTIEWFKDPYIYVHEAKNIETINYYIKKAVELKVAISEWRDTVYIKFSETQMNAIPNTLIGISLGPCDSDEIKAVIGDLPLL